MAEIITGKVIKVINDYKIVINKGFADGVTMGTRFLVFRLGEELFDPDTNESLGILELVCGEGKPEHIQEHISTLYTAKTIVKKTKTVKKSGPYGGLFGETEEIYDPETDEIPFDDVSKDCLVRQIK
ncbi:MAG: hypothetical protein Q4B75_10265 [Eubacteriales bacterium]|nr:hypothetical protein [Eubacteriales bacterium]